MRHFVFAVFAVSLGASPTFAADGAKLFALQCKSCHAAKSSPMGPALNGVMGANIAAREDYKYSAALKAKGGTWTAAKLDAYLASPSAFAPGGRMNISVSSEANRAAIIGYVETLK